MNENKLMKKNIVRNERKITNFLPLEISRNRRFMTKRVNGSPRFGFKKNYEIK